jgi:uncharacterized membrane protein
MVEEILKTAAETAALSLEGAGIVLITYGAVEAVCRSVVSIVRGPATHGQRKEVRMRFGAWLLLGLEFALAADIIRTAISPTWSDIGQLAAIALIRTFLNYFLERDLDKYDRPGIAADAESTRPLPSVRAA